MAARASSARTPALCRPSGSAWMRKWNRWRCASVNCPVSAPFGASGWLSSGRRGGWLIIAVVRFFAGASRDASHCAALAATAFPGGLVLTLFRSVDGLTPICLAIWARSAGSAVATMACSLCRVLSQSRAGGAVDAGVAPFTRVDARCAWGSATGNDIGRFTRGRETSEREQRARPASHAPPGWAWPA